MSRIGKQIIEIPEKTEVTLDGGLFTVKGPKGELKREFKDDVAIMIDGNSITLKPTKETPFANALWGTYASHIKNMIQGVNTPYEKKLIIEGVGFKSEITGNELVLSLGFSHKINVSIPEDVAVTAEKNVITIIGIDKEHVGGFASKVRILKKPEPYKGKGIRYHDEVVRRKQGKKVGAE
ncbi:50S ribosomal protein L6 [Candidatus Wolfebacteria bacterium]|nr:MAG: 50S ribosomal protein L6 [Candidatus Wolfebacteria bacterium]